MRLYHEFQLQTVLTGIVFLVVGVVIIENFSEYIPRLYLVLSITFAAVVALSWRLLLASEIFRRRPETIIGVGSGTSTLVAAYCLKKLGRGKMISLDHLEKYADITHQIIQSHGLEDYADACHAPLKEYRTNNIDAQSNCSQRINNA